MIVGLGWWGRTLVESGQGSDFIRFVAGATRTVSPEVTAFADTYKLRLAENFDALLKDSTVQAVVLCTPHSMHTRQVVAAAQAGKHVFCEKPFALNKSDAERAVDATRKAGITLGLGYNRRFHPPFPHEGRHVGLSGYTDRDGAGLQLSSLRLERVGTSGRHDPCRGSFLGRTAYAIIRYVQVSTGER